jgi:hypothetical protein
MRDRMLYYIILVIFGDKKALDFAIKKQIESLNNMFSEEWYFWSSKITQEFERLKIFIIIFFVLLGIFNFWLIDFCVGKIINK